MKVKKFFLATALFAVVGVLLSLGLLGTSILNNASGIRARVNTTPTPEAGNAIERENAQTGSAGWKIPLARQAKTQIQAYAGATSVSPGGKIDFFVSTQQDRTNYKIEVFRLGWYQGLGGRLMASVSNLVGHAQGYYDQTTDAVVGCTSCITDDVKQPGLLEARWASSYTLTVGTDWTTGIYLAKFTDSNGWQTYAPFDVRPLNQNSRYIAVTPDTTYAAYNRWGGASLYYASNEIRQRFAAQPRIFAPGAGIARVSFDKPYASGLGAADTLLYVVQFVRWMEHSGFDVSYMSDVDLHEHGDWLLTHKAYISLGHDEYWTTQMYDAVQGARDRGIGLAFMGANAVYWHMRFEASSTGRPDRTIVCYKVASGPKNDLARDPLYQAPTTFVPRPDNREVTTQWRDKGRTDLPIPQDDGLAYRPEQTLVGNMQSDLTHTYAPGFPWQVSKTADPNSLLLKGTGLEPGKSYGCGLVGYEWDNVDQKYPFPQGVTNIHMLSESPVYSELTRNQGTRPVSNSTYYIAPSGAMVFATGSFFFTSALDNYRSPEMFQTTPPNKYCGRASKAIPDLRTIPGMNVPNTAVPGIQMLMANVMKELVNKHTPNS